MPDSSTALRERVLLAAATSSSPTRREGRRIGVGLLAASVAIAVTVFEGIGGLEHSRGRPLSVTLGLSIGWAASSAGLTWLVVGRGGSTMARRPLWLALAVLASPFLLFGWTQLFYGTYTEPFEHLGWRCLGYTLAVAALPLVGFLGMRRAIEPRAPSVLGAAAGACCASWGGALIDLWCPLTSPKHVLFGHVLPLIVAIALGAIAGRWTLGARKMRTA